MTEGEIILNFGTNLNKKMHEFRGGAYCYAACKTFGNSKKKYIPLFSF